MATFLTIPDNPKLRKVVRNRPPGLYAYKDHIWLCISKAYTQQFGMRDTMQMVDIPEVIEPDILDKIERYLVGEGVIEAI